jgi:hypothetical protein
VLRGEDQGRRTLPVASVDVWPGVDEGADDLVVAAVVGDEDVRVILSHRHSVCSLIQ